MRFNLPKNHLAPYIALNTSKYIRIPVNPPTFQRLFSKTLPTQNDTSELSVLTKGEKYLYEKLAQKFRPSKLKVQDISGGCGDMYAVVIASEAFEGLPTVQQHRLVNELLKEDIKKLHGLQLKTSVK
ncbi:hypothetical protein G9A89_009457 [Geosiphon pyriformis]|nr:hypothetical protein G9A89_009457 [Geosiphon pyriformis]